MYQTRNNKEKLWLFIKIFLPILIYQFANYSASFIDTMMTGQYSTMDLAGVSMATSLWNPLFHFLQGLYLHWSRLLPNIWDKERSQRFDKSFISLSIYLLD